MNHLAIFILSLVFAVACDQQSPSNRQSKRQGAAKAEVKKKKQKSVKIKAKSSVSKDPDTEDDDAGLKLGFLTSEDLDEPSDASMLDLVAMRDKLSDSSSFFQFRPEQSTTGSESEAEEEEEEEGGDQSVTPRTNPQIECVQKLLESQKVQATTTTIRIEIDLDLGICQPEGNLRVSGRSRSLLIYSCSSADFNSWNGRSIASLVGEERSFADLCKSGQVHVFSQIKSSRVVDTGGVSYVHSIVSALMTRDGAPCPASIEDSTVTYEDGCTKTDATESGLRSSPDRTFLRAEFQDLKAEIGGLWYKSGRAKVSFNNWKGEVVFRGVDVAPSYRLTNADESDEGWIGSHLADET